VRSEVAVFDGMVTVVPELEGVGAVNPTQHRAPIVIGSAVFARPPTPANVPALRAIIDANDGDFEIVALAVGATNAGKCKSTFGKHVGIKSVRIVYLTVPIPLNVHGIQRRTSSSLGEIKRIVVIAQIDAVRGFGIPIAAEVILRAIVGIRRRKASVLKDWHGASDGDRFRNCDIPAPWAGGHTQNLSRRRRGAVRYQEFGRRIEAENLCAGRTGEILGCPGIESGSFPVGGSGSGTRQTCGGRCL